ncbi:MAG: hypothetical protein EOM67_16570 [Spirochaetia bacterium]|nr:hypothetical protein [Spirochaetia bacterium]
MIIKLVDKNTGTSWYIPIPKINHLETGSGTVKCETSDSLKILKGDHVLSVNPRMLSEVNNGDTVKFFESIKDDFSLEADMWGPIEGSWAYSPKDYDGYILEDGKTVDKI